MPEELDISDASAPAPASAPKYLTERDKHILSQLDGDHQPHDWDKCKAIIANNGLAVLTRFPSDLRRYIAWSASTKEKYGNMTNFLLQERLQWSPLPSSDPDAAPTFAIENPVPFASPKDYRVLPNDWPYGFVPGIKHICVWLKSRLPVDDTEGDLTIEGREMVNQFVNQRFVKLLGADRVLWFKNWAKLQSVRGVEHLHVLVKDVSNEQLANLVDQLHTSDGKLKSEDNFV